MIYKTDGSDNSARHTLQRKVYEAEINPLGLGCLPSWAGYDDPCDPYEPALDISRNGMYPFKLYPYQQALFNAAMQGGKLAPITLNPTRSVLQHFQMVGRVLRPVPVSDPCDEVDHERFRPIEPFGDKAVWYYGWEIAYSFEADIWTGEGWIAYKGGCDLGAPELRAGRFTLLLDEIEAEEME